MITVHTAEFFISIITFFIAYVIVCVSTNIFTAWVAARVGDDTGERLGFLTLNPFFHIDPLGTICLFIFYFGWGRPVPIIPHNIRGPHRILKLLVAYLSDSFAHFILSIIGITVLLGIFDINILGAMRYMVFTYNVSHLPVANMYPHVSSLVVSIGFIMFAFVYLNVVLGVLSFIIHLCQFILSVLSDRYENAADYSHYITIGLPIVLILFLSPLLRLLSVYLISYIGIVIAHVLGIAG